jgi:hypothetical protein
MKLWSKSVLWLTCSLILLSGSRASTAPILFGGNAYEYIESAGISFDAAVTAAEGMTFLGRSGHLVTIFSPGENAFVLSLLSSVDQSIWLGATDRAVEGEWRWVTGERFWQGNASGTAGPDVFYQNWGLGQPDDFGTGQDLAKMFGASIPVVPGFSPGGWDDGGGGTTGVFGIDGYVVKYDVVPEPTSIVLLTAGLAGMTVREWRKRQAK